MSIDEVILAKREFWKKHSTEIQKIKGFQGIFTNGDQGEGIYLRFLGKFDPDKVDYIRENYGEEFEKVPIHIDFRLGDITAY